MGTNGLGICIVALIERLCYLMIRFHSRELAWPKLMRIPSRRLEAYK
ncbi:hypothetical protein VDG1235_3689 [Verrucomicrobiia bacterium DG1235]|nr:hypothetical protein VDG1235_3689 [Verrucomicrobiae bacterium DG1235]